MVPGLSIEHLVILGVIALVVVGPKDLPLLLRKLGQFTAKLRGMAQEFRSGFDELARQAELDELKKEVEALRRTTNLTDIGNQLTKSVTAPLGTLESYAGLPPTNYPPPAPALSEAEVKAEPPKTEAPASAGDVAPPMTKEELQQALSSPPVHSVEAAPAETDRVATTP